MRTTKFAALFATVALLVVGAAFASFAGWVPEGDDWTYYNAKGEQVFEEWQQDNGSWFWLDESGLMAKDEIVNWKDNFYYVDENGVMLTSDWKKITDDAYDVNEDDVDYRWFYFGSDGKAYKNTMKDCPTAAGTKTFIFNSNGEMLYNYVEKLGGDEKYEMTTDYTVWSASTAAAYWCGSADDGAVLKDDWVSLQTDEDDNGDAENSWFYCQPSGKIAKATTGNKSLTIKGVSYTFDIYGIMQSGWDVATSTEANNFYIDKETGARVTKGWFQAYDQAKDSAGDIDEEEDELYWFYAKKKNQLACSEILSIGGKWYAFNDECRMVYGLVEAMIDPSDKSFDVDYAITMEGDVTSADFEELVLSDHEYGADVLYYFNEAHDGTFGSMKTGVQTVTNDDETYTLTFKSAKNFTNYNGSAYNGIEGNFYYQNGSKYTFDADDNRYWIVKATSVDTTKSKAVDAIDVTGAQLKDAKMASEMWTADTKDLYDGQDYIVMTAAGSFCKSLTNKTDSDSYKLTVKNYELKTIVNAN